MFRCIRRKTKVRATLALKPNPKSVAAPLVLDGDGLSLVSLKLDGAALPADSYVATPDSLTIPQPPNGPFTLEIETLVDPSANTQLSGLYRSSGTYCTQCEAEGFRRITYFPDRPDVMAVYTTRIEADKTEAPVLLANGNLVESGELAAAAISRSGTIRIPSRPICLRWSAAILLASRTAFVTMSGRNVTLRIYVEHGKQDRCAYAMDSLKRAMRWDEEAFGREYDLDIFMIVAVSDFNMGAMENKGLNVFNDKYVLASADTATDADFAHIEAVIAHEYFHNWTGNRITCRDWFQLCLKEGLTVFRDQEFSSDMRSRPVKRIADVRGLRAAQFVEDAGPLAHPVRPETYKEINNFYTTHHIRERRRAGAHGADVDRPRKIPRRHGSLFRAPRRRSRHCRAVHPVFRRRQRTRPDAIHALVQPSRHAGGDGPRPIRCGAQDLHARMQARRAADAGAADQRTDGDSAGARPGRQGRTRSAAQAVERRADRARRGGAERAGRDVRIHRHRGAAGAFSINRGFSAPIKLVTDLDADDLAFLAAHDSDPFNRWQALQTISMRLLIDNVAALRSGRPTRSDDQLIAALAAILEDTALEPAFVALALVPPGEGDIAREIGRDIDPDAIFRARTALRAASATAWPGALHALRPNGRIRRLFARRQRAPDAAPCAMSRSICWRPRASPRTLRAPHGNTRPPTT